MRIRTRRGALAGLSALTLTGALAGATVATSAPARAAEKTSTLPSSVQISSTTGTGLAPGAIKHVWLIILENKSYDATFTGLNKNSYLWQTLPSQGVLLKDYYGTGHFSQDNYESLVSGQAPQQDTQSDCSVSYKDFGTNANIVTTGANKKSDNNYGQVLSPAGANAANGANGCVYPSNVPTLFNQLDAAGKSWKGYNQDLGDATGREDGPCGAPGTAANNPTTNPTAINDPSAYGVTSFTGAQTNDQYVAKHSPFPWFHSLLDGDVTTPVGGGTDCDGSNVVNLDNASTGLVHDLQSESTTPDFSWITPDNCSDAHDAVCKGNNLSGAFDTAGNPQYGKYSYDPENAQPTNYTGGLYASDLFLKWYIPLIERSKAFSDGGLIDVTFDEANPPFTYSGNSFYNASAYGPTSKDTATAKGDLKADLAGENLDGKNKAFEPTGPNTPLAKSAAGQELYPGPGDNAFIDRPAACTSVDPPTPSGCVPGLVAGGAGSVPGPRTDVASAGATTNSIVLDKSIVATDTGRAVTDTVDSPSPIPANTFVGQVTDVGKPALSNSDTAVEGSFQLVDANGSPVTPTGSVSSITLSGETPATDPLYDATDATPGGGDTGSVLISPYITPGTSTTTDYNHYSWLRTMEDVFDVSAGGDHTPLTPGAGSVSGGLDGAGHLGYAAQVGLAGFGPDVFDNPGGQPAPSTTGAATTAPAAGTLLGLPLAGLLAVGAGRRRRRAA